MKMDKVAGSGNDEFYTPAYAIKPILKYVEGGAKVWCPFDTADSLFVKELRTHGCDVIPTHINNGQDFFNTRIPECDYIISNPPFSSVYVCHGMLPKTIIFEEISKAG